MIEVWLSQWSFLKIIKKIFRTKIGNMMWVKTLGMRYIPKNMSILLLITNNNRDMIQNPVQLVKTNWLSIFELKYSIYFILSNKGFNSKSWGCIGINLWHHFKTTFSWLYRNICASSMIYSLICNINQTMRCSVEWVCTIILTITLVFL